MQNVPKQPWEDRVADASARVQEELHRVLRYIDEEVVPEVRRNGSSALRAAADKLQQLAKHIDDAQANSAQANAAQTKDDSGKDQR